METKVLLIRHGITEWHQQGKVLGQRDVDLCPAGRAQMRRTAESLEGCRIAEVIASPLQRAVQSAEILGTPNGIEVARDPRLTDLALGTWSGRSRAEVAQSAEYDRFLSAPAGERVLPTESLDEIRRRGVAAVEQAITDNPSGDAIAIVTHASIIRILIAHYLGAPAASFHRIRVDPGSVSVLGFGDPVQPRLFGTNLTSDLRRLVHT